jgi:hypothetical protein
LTPGEVALAAFTLCNALRLGAYLPQIVRIGRDAGGATAISYTTWGIFTVSNLSTVAYALITLGDPRMALVFGVNAACCVGVLAITAVKRAQVRRGAGPDPGKAPVTLLQVWAANSGASGPVTLRQP